MAWRSISDTRRWSWCCRFGLALLVLVLTGCGSTRSVRPAQEKSRPWLVKSHQREFLADRIMRPDADGQERAADHHVLTTREGAMGGTGTVGGGCGCN